MNNQSSDSGIIAAKTRWLLDLLVFVVIGAVVVFAADSVLGIKGLILAVIAPILLLVFILSLKHLLNGIRALRKSFSWWHAIWLLLFVSGLTWRDRSAQAIAAQAVDTAAAFRIALVGIVAIILLLRLGLRQTSWVRSMSLGLIALLSAYGLVGLASTLWSVFPAWTLYRSVEFLVDIAAVAAIVATLASAKGCKALFDWTWTLCGLLLATVWIGAVVAPQLALPKIPALLGVELVGLMPAVSSDAVGQLGAVLSLVAICRLLLPAQKSSKSFYVSLFTVGIVTMIFAQGRSAILGFVLGAAVILFLSGRIRLGAALGVVAVAIASATSVRGTLFNYMRRGESPEELRTLTDRVVWWRFAWSKFLEHPILGYGAYAGGRFVAMAGLGLNVSSLHSDYVGILVDTGLCGFVVAVAVVIGAWAVLIRCFRSAYATPLERCLLIEAAGVFTEMTVRSFFGPALFWHFPMTFLAVLVCVEFLRRRQKQRQSAAAVSLRERELTAQPVS